MNDSKERVRKRRIEWTSKVEIRPITGLNWFLTILKRDLDVKLGGCLQLYFHKIQISLDDKWLRFIINETIYFSDSIDINLGRLRLKISSICLQMYFQEWKTMRIGWTRPPIYIETTIVAKRNFWFKIWRIWIWAETKRNG